MDRRSRRSSSAWSIAIRSPGSIVHREGELANSTLPPVARPAASVGNRENLHLSPALAVHDHERESPQHEPTRAFEVLRPTTWRIDDLLDRMIELFDEPCREQRTPLGIPMP